MNTLLQRIVAKYKEYRKNRLNIRFRNKVDEAIDITFDEYRETFDNLAEYDKGMI